MGGHAAEGTVTDAPDSELEARMRRIERQFREVQRLANVGSWEWDVRDDHITWSDELYRIFGESADGFAATFEAYVQRLHPDDRELVTSTVQRSMQERRPYAFDHRVQHPDGTVRWVHSRGDVDVDDAGEPIRLYGIAIDITDRKRVDEFVRQFIVTAGHELRTPVAAIGHAIELLASNGHLPESDRSETLRILALQGHRLRTLSENLLDMATVEPEPSHVLLDAIEIAGAVQAALRDAPRRDGVEVAADVPEELEVRANRQQLERVLVNLLTNVAEHGGDHATVRAWEEEFDVVIEVTDDGPGVPESLVADLFSPFRAGRGDTEGPGLGLAVSRSLVSAMGGSIEHAPLAPHGARFRVRLSPAAAG